MKFVLVVILSIFLVFLCIQIYSFSKRGETVEREYGNLAAQAEKAREDYRNLQADFTYYLNPENLEKELRARFNYREAGEKLIVIVPAKPSPATATTP